MTCIIPAIISQQLNRHSEKLVDADCCHSRSTKVAKVACITRLSRLCPGPFLCHATTSAIYSARQMPLMLMRNRARS